MFVLDTNVVSELRKVSAGRADPNVARWAGSMETVNLYLSAITIEELEIGVLLAERRDPQQGTIYRAWMDILIAKASGHRQSVLRSQHWGYPSNRQRHQMSLYR